MFFKHNTQQTHFNFRFRGLKAHALCFFILVKGTKHPHPVFSVGLLLVSSA